MAGSSSMFVPGTMVPTRLMNRLDGLLSGRLAVISGPAGFHKTALVRTWMEKDPDIFKLSISGVIRRDTDKHDPKGVLDAIAERVNQGVPVVVFIDNQDYLKDVRILHDFLDVADRHGEVRLIFCGRNRPNVPLSGLSMRGLVVDIDARDLALTREEVSELITNQGSMGDAIVDVLMEEFEGWPIAVELLRTQQLGWSALPHLETIIDGYLQEEVLDDFGEDDLIFLQDLSALSEFTPQGAAYLTDRADAGPTITNLAAKGIPLTWAQGNIIHLNPALRRYLVRTLADEDPTRATRQNRRAAAWLQRQGQPRDAIRHAIDSSDRELVYDLLTNYLYLNLASNETDVAAFVEELAPILPEDFQLPLARTLLLAVAQPDAVPVSALRGVCDQIPATATPTELARFHATLLYVARDTLYATHRSMVSNATTFAADVLDEKITIPPLESGFLMGEYGVYLLEHGELRRAQDALQHAVSSARIAGMQWAATWALGALALVNSLTAGTGATRRLAEEAVLSAETRGIKQAASVEMALLALAITSLDMGDLDDAQSYVDRLIRLPGYLMPGNAVFRTFVTASLAAARDEHEQALQSIRAFRGTLTDEITAYQQYLLDSVEFAAHLSLGSLPDATTTLRRITMLGLSQETTGVVVLEARLSMARGDSVGAITKLAPHVDSEHPFGNARHWLLLLMTYGMAATQANQNEAALSAFQRAGVLAERLGLNTPRARHTRSASQLRHDQLDLTAAEQNVLRALAKNAPLTEIALELFISPNTLKTHLRRIYRKLGVGGRDEAVERAKVLGMRLD